MSLGLGWDGAHSSLIPSPCTPKAMLQLLHRSPSVSPFLQPHIDPALFSASFAGPDVPTSACVSLFLNLTGWEFIPGSKSSAHSKGGDFRNLARADPSR
jgi:hypothetical protein